jgi:hypothetical protein
MSGSMFSITDPFFKLERAAVLQYGTVQQSAEGGASSQFLTLGECPAICLSRLGAIPQRHSKKFIYEKIIDEDLAIAIHACSRSLDDRCYCSFHIFVVHDHVKPDLWQELNAVFTCPPCQCKIDNDRYCNSC